ncbi:hypothetical protein ASPZODRAFT_140243 [Penicilliopsis zonata CBS 506.65]|uniref:Protein phosphatase 4 core regulatory subunit R2 n=1 Tax=Penicilliopsis zonata CBS 506.65 TaxID=1073090 RepID=A0A1L9SQD0_9EURO|nr:hypothetical protein ASPZODRAFT_140243 [Penicilliopsis zonata CBS 506.65]OJJ49336.1 hypothetical protein ASPZODRAFT_140243 [Penicilliopsis zonata CBS 506.65]
MSLDESILEAVAQGNAMDYEKWPAMVEPVVERLEDIVYNVFPRPRIPYEVPSNRLLPSSIAPLQSQDPSGPPNSSNKENTSPIDLQATPGQTNPPASTLLPSSERVPDSQPQSFVAASNDSSLAPQLVSLLDHIKITLRTVFDLKPPHTIQRLAELILRPNAHYRTLPAYLRAVDRVVSVTSGADIFPLQVQSRAEQPNGLLNGGTSSGFMMSDHNLGSDESLGGALLTPIPWLSNVSAEDADAVLSGETKFTALDTSTENNQELDLNSLEPQSSTTVADNAVEAINISSSGLADAESDEAPHARGPRVVGVEDMGLQDGKGVEMTLADADDKASGAGASNEQQMDQDGTETDAISTKGIAVDGDGDIVLGDDDIKATEQDSLMESTDHGKQADEASC